MPSLTHVRKSALTQPGFYWKGNKTLATVSQISRGRFYGAIVGRINFAEDGSVDIGPVKQAAEKQMSILMQTVISYAARVHSDQGAELSTMWDVMQAEFTRNGNEMGTLTPDEIRIAFEGIVEARQTYSGTSNPTTNLTELVDRFLNMME
jgi:hypothetical protein